jgi:methionyl-tRNA formyltransferase
MSGCERAGVDGRDALEAGTVGAATESWRVVVVSNLPDGLIYKIAHAVLSPLGHRIVGVVTSPGPKRRRSSAYLGVVAAVPPGVDVLVSNHPDRWAAMLAPLRPDLIVCGGMPWRLRPELLALPRLGAINIHPALLPRYRGPAAVEWALRNGDPEIGLTVHRMSPDFDTGPILAQASVPLTDDDDFASLMAKFMPIAPALFGQAIERVARGDPGEPQDESRATYAGLFEEEWRTIDWRRPARTVHNQVRSWVGFREVPGGAFGEVDGETQLITKTRLLPADAGAAGAPPGAVVRREGGEIVVQCRDGSLAIVEWDQPPSGENEVGR